MTFVAFYVDGIYMAKKMVYFFAWKWRGWSTINLTMSFAI